MRYVVIFPHHFQTVVPKRRYVQYLPRLYVELQKLHLAKSRVISLLWLPNIERRRKFIVAVVLVQCHVFRGPPRRHLHHIFAPSDVDITTFKRVVRQRRRDAGGPEQQIVTAKYGERRFQVFVELLVVSLDARFFDKILVATAKIFALGVGFHQAVGGAQRENHGSGWAVGVVVGDLFHINVETPLFGDHFCERHRLEIGIVFAELEHERLFQIGIGVDVFVGGVIGFVDFDVVALFELEYDLAIQN